jgi:hypothetical protein
VYCKYKYIFGCVSLSWVMENERKRDTCLGKSQKENTRKKKIYDEIKWEQAKQATEIITGKNTRVGNDESN